MGRVLPWDRANPDRKYTPSASTDIRKTFARERARLKAEAEAKPKANVRELKKVKT